jgi:hypothetical protein
MREVYKFLIFIIIGIPCLIGIYYIPYFKNIGENMKMFILFFLGLLSSFLSELIINKIYK